MTISPKIKLLPTYDFIIVITNFSSPQILAVHDFGIYKINKYIYLVKYIDSWLSLILKLIHRQNEFVSFGELAKECGIVAILKFCFKILC